MTTAPTAAPAPAGTSLAPTVRLLWGRFRGRLIAVLLLLLCALVYAAVTAETEYPPLDPRSADPDGARAVARLLERRGVTLEQVSGPGRAIADGTPSTVLVPSPGLLTADQLRELQATVDGSGGRIVLIAPGRTELQALSPHTRLPGGSPDKAPAVPSASTAPDCDLPEAVRAGSAELGGLLYLPPAGATACYPRFGLPSLVRTTEGSGDTVILGSAAFLTNDRLGEDGNASLALGLLGAHQRLLWYLPDYDSAAASGQGDRTFLDLVPAGWRWGLLQAAVAGLLAALWRARRLGPVVPENLPVVVRAAETTEGHARLYQRAKARGRAAEALRHATRSRLAPLLGVPARPDPDPAALTAAVAARLAEGQNPARLHALLYGAAPADDSGLLRLADELDTLERQVRQP